MKKTISPSLYSEVDVLNVALFGITASEWKTQNSDKKGLILRVTQAYNQKG